MVVDPPEGPEAGNALSPSFTRTALIGKPNVSAATCVIQVRVPVPISWLPISTSIVPSALMDTLHLEAWPAPPQVAIPKPTPRRMLPVSAPRGCHFFFQSISSAALTSCLR